MKRALLLLFLLPIFISSCKTKEQNLLEREEHFTISLGVMADELDFFYRDELFFPGTSEIFMENGIFYISSMQMGKLLEFNSYGDLLMLIYSESKNTKPDQELYNAIPYSFNKIGRIGKTGNLIIAEDTLIIPDLQPDEELGVKCDQVLLRFTENGEYIDYLGRNGIGGDPFPIITDINFCADGSIFVLTKTFENILTDDKVTAEEKIIGYWFNSEGVPISQINIFEALLPQWEDKVDFHKSLVSIKPDEELFTLNVVVDYFPIVQQESSDKNSYRRLYSLDLNSGEYDDGITIQDLILQDEENSYNMAYDYIGVTKDGNHFFTAPMGSNSYNLMIMNRTGKVVVRKNIFLGEEPVLFSRYHLSPEGLLTAILFHNDGATVCWWRSDKL